jgi:hypothetical protein
MGRSRKREICMVWQLVKQYSFKRSDRASPSKDKRIFLVENYPKNIEKLPCTLQEA